MREPAQRQHGFACDRRMLAEEVARFVEWKTREEDLPTDGECHEPRGKICGRRDDSTAGLDLEFKR
jgi:hypothetical protein